MDWIGLGIALILLGSFLGRNGAISTGMGLHIDARA
jgi:hypothetical protein